MKILTLVFYPLNLLFLGMIRAYQFLLSPLIGGSCRFYPTCSEYAAICMRNLFFPLALGRMVWRLLRCQPWSAGGFDHPLHAPGWRPDDLDTPEK